MNEKVEIEGVLAAARLVLDLWNQLRTLRETSAVKDRPAAVGRFFQPIVAAHSNLFNAGWMATGWKRSEKENRVVVALRQYALSILSRAEFAGELWLDGDDHRRWVHAHVDRLAGEQVHKTDWSRQAQQILDSGATLDNVERAALTGCLTARAITPCVQALLDAIGVRCVVTEVLECDSEPAAAPSPTDSESPTKRDLIREQTAVLAEREPDDRKRELTDTGADSKPADEPARRRG